MLYIDENTIGNNCSTGEVRLQEGSNEYEGRAEVCINGVWGSICDNGWNKSDANAFCGQLGYSSYGTYRTLMHLALKLIIIINDQKLL